MARAQQMMNIAPDRPLPLREAIRACRDGGIVSGIGAYGGLNKEYNCEKVVLKAA